MQTPLRILIVDDEPGLRKLVTAILGSEGNTIDEAENGAKALKMVSENVYDLIITDLVMPEVNGIDLIMALKDRQYPGKIIAVSGGGGITGRFDYLEISEIIGANSILSKPFTEDDIKDLISSLFKD